MDLSIIDDLWDMVNSNNYLIFLAIGIMLLWFIIDNFTGKRHRTNEAQSDQLCLTYYYEGIDGAANWPQRYPSSNGNNQSPINFIYNNATIISSETRSYLKFSESYNQVSSEFKLFNSGYNVVLYFQWYSCVRPEICGGPLNDSYRFLNARFRWGYNSVEGSEHTIEHRRGAMELQLMFVKSSATSGDILHAAKNDALLIICYIYKESRSDNIFLAPIVAALKQIRSPMMTTCLEPIHLSLLAPQFMRQYYYYKGSLTFPPCTEGVHYIVQSEPLAVSARQVKKFRQIFGCYGNIRSNVRPVQKVNNRKPDFYV